ncbi:D345L [African swine fever virus]|uniref:Protein D345L n=1 Tax=African swine fever virus TaxID=10497 RepID=A0A6V6ZFB8_ASF|nr:D345L [African swine fever virus]WEG41993.1 D345L [African swine fever virus]WEG42453.1 D345L [African swine fever virus]WEG42632.1 D345L [African swine fever virus]WLE28975.1 D345L [African swine fever virus]
METFVRLFKDSPQQRSDAWHAIRRTQVGGSDLASVLGLNPYKSYYITLAEKANLFKKNLNRAACSWGTLFERVSKDLLELFCQTTVIGDNIHIDGTYLGYPGHSNSPDGFCHLTLGYTQQSWEIKTIFNNVRYEATKRIPVLVEIKSPFNRKIKNSVPSYYMPQIQSGLALSPPISMGIYVEAMFRVCGIHQLGSNNETNTDIHPPESMLPLAWGIITICSTQEHTEAPQDFGTLDAETFRQLLETLYQKDQYTIHYSMPYETACPEMPNVVGYFGWKVFIFQIIPVTKHPQFLKDKYPIIQQFLRDLHTIKASPSPMEMYEKICCSEESALSTEDIDNFTDMLT